MDTSSSVDGQTSRVRTLDPLNIEESEYTYLLFLASGGMGRVDLAMRSVDRFRRLYAIKHIHSHLALDEKVRAMFEEEARIAGSLNHANVVGVIDVGADSLSPYMVMDFVEGLTLTDLISLANNQGNWLPVAICLRIGLGVARGLDAIHHAADADGALLGLVHRDLSPRNVLLGFDGSVRVTDFGIARALDRDIQTTVGILKGTPGYVAPERLRFEEPSPKADLFSFGVLLYEMLAGERLYSGPFEEAARRILDEPPPDIGELRPHVPPELVDLLFRLLAKDPRDRPQDAAEVVHRLEQVLFAVQDDDVAVDLGPYLSLAAADRKAELRERIDEALRRVDGETQPGRRTRPKRWRRLGLAAVAAAVLLSLAALWRSTTAAPETPRAALTPTVEPVAAPPSEAPRPKPPAEVEPTEVAVEEPAQDEERSVRLERLRAQRRAAARRRRRRVRSEDEDSASSATGAPREMSWSGRLR